MIKDRDRPSRGFSEDHHSFSRKSYGPLLDRVFLDILEESRDLDAQRAAAPGLIEELKELSGKQRTLLIRNLSQFHVWPVIENLLDNARSCWADDPVSAEDLALSASEISEFIEVTGFREKLLNDLKAEIWTCVANCRRIRSDLQASSEAFSIAEQYLAEGTGDEAERARFLDLKSSLFRAQRMFAEASEALRVAIAIYRRLPDRHAEGRALIKQAKLLGDAGEPGAAIEALENARPLLDIDREPRLEFLCLWNLAAFLNDENRPEEAQSLMPKVRRLARSRGGRSDRLRVLWIEALIRKNLGQPQIAEEALRQVRDGFISAAIGYDVALVSLDLAALYLESGRVDKVRGLALETLPLLASRDVHRELLAMWSIFCQAAEREVATLQVINDVARQIRAAQGSYPSSA